MNTNTVILGGYQTDFARNWQKEEKHIVALMRESFNGAIISTEIDAIDIECAIVGNFTGELFSNQGILGSLMVDIEPKLVGKPTMRIECACASGAAAILSASSYIQAGIYDLVCVMGVEQMKTVSPEKCAQFLGTASWYEEESNGIDFPFPKLFSSLADEYDKRYSLDTKHLSYISAKNYENAQRNPNAQTRDWYMSFDHANHVGVYNKILWGMLKTSDCSQITDGAACIFLSSEEYAKKYTTNHSLSFEKLPRLLGWGHTTAPLKLSEKLKESNNQKYIFPHTRKAIEDAFKTANIQNCWELDAIETHDCFTSSEYMAIDHFGITEPGESWKAIEDETISFTGKLPVNPSGGLIGCGHPVGATGVRQALDAYKQVTDKAGDYQIENANKIGTLNIGGSGSTNIAMVIGT